MSGEAIVLQDARLDPDRPLLEGIDTSEGPTFKVSQFGQIFFARTDHWVRWLEGEHKFVIDGDPECPHYAKVKRDVEQYVGGTLKNNEVDAKESWVVDGVCTKCGGRQVGASRTATGSRIYTLSDIEQVTHALLANNAISGQQAINALHLVQTMARIHGLLA